MRLEHLVKFSLCLTLVVIMLGAYTRLADAGLGCPDWPGCYGQLLVPQTQEEVSTANALFPERAVEQGKAWLEMIHRYFAGSLGIVILVMAIWATNKQDVDATIPILLCLLVLGQAALGMWTVTLKLMPSIVMLHLFGGFTLLALQAVFYCQLKSHSPPLEAVASVSKGVKLLSVFTFGIVTMQILLGGWTSSNYAALMCTSLPICEGNWQAHLSWKEAFSFWQTGFDSYEFGVLDYPARMTIHVSHRIGAMVTAAVVLGYIVVLYQQQFSSAKKIAFWLGFVLLCQIALGISNVLFQLPIYVAVAHNFGAALMLALICVSQFYIWQSHTYRYAQAKGVRYE
ncbi:cytochrome B [Vibrio azureus]|uniref:Cytochrome oxidase assembly protein n=1 Tax=Vibrio azureus NBRC 104587 TaxID=1219077 RepID=U3AWU4_9VIBR|nr:COX15/CtaA family protein [Vibrio azureus]AUI88438.1 cytochrome B [Vibrio azureus]GAD77692.1 hypothetical protein VAZ01S_086_00060 [Vibrio azureus NBRC 104587]